MAREHGFFRTAKSWPAALATHGYARQPLMHQILEMKVAYGGVAR
jgi:hypothetical protein